MTSPPRNRMRRAILCAVAIVACCAASWSFVASSTGSVPSYAAVRAGSVSSDAQLLDRRGEPLQGLRVDRSQRRLQWIALDDVSPALQRAVVAAEDRNFYRHAGIDWRALAVAAWSNARHVFTAARPRGASTISMQLAGLLDDDLKPARNGRGVAQKWRQMIAACALERDWTKAQIFEAYLNLVTYRGELQGVDAAAHALYGKLPSGVDNNEALVLAALIRAPAASLAAVGRRACALARAVPVDNRCADIEWSALQALQGNRGLAATTGVAPRIAEKLLRTDSRQVRSTLDGDLQRFAVAALQQQLAGLRARNVNDGAVVVLDNASGDVLAYVANAGDSAVDGVAALRQAGSTLKPFLYELAIESRQLTAASLLDDAPLDIVTPAGLYVPQNYDRTFRGLVSVRTSLGNSLNVPAVRTLLLSGLEPFHQRLRRLGFDSLIEAPDYYGYALALGGAEVSLLELTNAYRSFAQRGRWSPVRLRMESAAGELRPAMDERAAFIVADILGDNAARTITFGMDNVLATPFWSAVKTGTSKDMRDNWCVGFSERFTVGVWVGNFDGQSMWDVSGVTGAAPVWREVMGYLHAAASSAEPMPPAGVVSRSIQFRPAVEGTRREFFLAGTESESVEAVGASQRAAKIQYPGDGVVIAIDPDIPSDRQRVEFLARGAGKLFWQLDGKLLSKADVAALWRPVKGRHVLQLVAGDESVVDSVGFDVRGSERF